MELPTTGRIAVLALFAAAAGCAEPSAPGEDPDKCGNTRIRTVRLQVPWRVSADVPRGWKLDVFSSPDLEAAKPVAWATLTLLENACYMSRYPELRLESLRDCPAGTTPSACIAAWPHPPEEPPRAVRLGRWEGLEVGHQGEMEYFTSAGDSWHGYRERSFLLETPSGVVECSLRLWESPKDPGQVSRESRKYRSDHEAFCSSIRIE